MDSRKVSEEDVTATIEAPKEDLEKVLAKVKVEVKAAEVGAIKKLVLKEIAGIRIITVEEVVLTSVVVDVAVSIAEEGVRSVAEEVADSMEVEIEERSIDQEAVVEVRAPVALLIEPAEVLINLLAPTVISRKIKKSSSMTELTSGKQ